jgi:hypothetical protein
MEIMLNKIINKLRTNQSDRRPPRYALRG